MEWATPDKQKQIGFEPAPIVAPIFLPKNPIMPPIFAPERELVPVHK